MSIDRRKRLNPSGANFSRDNLIVANADGSLDGCELVWSAPEDHKHLEPTSRANVNKFCKNIKPVDSDATFKAVSEANPVDGNWTSDGTSSGDARLLVLTDNTPWDAVYTQVSDITGAIEVELVD